MAQTVVGNCGLCGQKKRLVDSHIWSKFGYKDFVADQSKGGQFVDLSNARMGPSNKQITKYCFCEDCEKRFEESYAKKLCRSILANGISVVCDYDYRLLRFLTSISLRGVCYHFECKSIDKTLSAAVRVWKEFLLDKRRDIGQYSQHAFIHLGTTHPKIMGGNLVIEEGFIVSHFGPFIIAGRTATRRNLPLKEIRIWDKSKVHQNGGTLTPITTYYAGNTLPVNNIPLSVAKYLLDEQKELARRAVIIQGKRK
jgi:hypothetical protein